MRRSSNNTVVTLIVFSVSMIIALIFIGILISKAGESRDMMAESSEEWSRLSENIRLYLLHDGESIRGREVVDMIDDCQEEYPCVVSTKGAQQVRTADFYEGDGCIVDGRGVKADPQSAGYYQGNRDIPDDVLDRDYINPYATFDVTVVRDANGNIIAILFRQR